MDLQVPMRYPLAQVIDDQKSSFRLWEQIPDLLRLCLYLHDVKDKPQLELCALLVVAFRNANQ
jgi:hypothetical protein